MKGNPRGMASLRQFPSSCSSVSSTFIGALFFFLLLLVLLLLFLDGYANVFLLSSGVIIYHDESGVTEAGICSGVTAIEDDSAVTKRWDRRWWCFCWFIFWLDSWLELLHLAMQMLPCPNQKIQKCSKLPSLASLTPAFATWSSSIINQD